MMQTAYTGFFKAWKEKNQYGERQQTKPEMLKRGNYQGMVLNVVERCKIVLFEEGGFLRLHCFTSIDRHHL
jgi:hypothetical protein